MNSKLWVEQSVTKISRFIAPLNDGRSVFLMLCACYLLTLPNWEEVYSCLPFNEVVWEWRHSMYDFEWNANREYHQQALYFSLIFYVPLRIYTVAVFVAAFLDGRKYFYVVSEEHFTTKTLIKFIGAFLILCPLLYLLHLTHVPSGRISEGSFLYHWFGTFVFLSFGMTWMLCALLYHHIFYMTSYFLGRKKLSDN